MAKEKSLVKLAKSGTKKATPKPQTKEVKAVKVEKPLTPEEERELKAKAKVEELLKDSELLAPPKEEELIEIGHEEPIHGVDWLEEQFQKLSEENERVKSELALSKEDYQRLFQQYQQSRGSVSQMTDSAEIGEIKTRVTMLFNELQQQQLSLGANFFIHPPSFLLRMIKFFPFLAQERRF